MPPFETTADPTRSQVSPTLRQAIDAWRELDVDLPLPTQTSDWVESCVEAFAEDAGDLLLAFARSGECSAATAALRRPGGVGGVPYEPVGATELSEPVDLAYHNRDALDALAEQLAAQRTPLRLPRLPEDSPTVSAIRRAYRGGGSVVVRPRRPYPLIDLAGGCGEYERLLSTSLRRDLRRARRKAQARGPVRFELYPIGGEGELADSRTGSGDEDARSLAALLEQAFAVEAASWKGDAGTALLQDRVRHQFFCRYARRAWSRGSLRLSFLRIGDTCAAMQLAVQTSDRFCLLKIGYDRQFAPCSPGLLLLADSLRHAVDQQLRWFDFLGAPAPWTRRWTQTERRCIELRAYPRTPTGVIWLSRDVATAVRHRARCKAEAAQRSAQRLRIAAGEQLQSALARAARGYVAGPTLWHATDVAGKLVGRGYHITLGRFDASDDTPDQVAEAAMSALDPIAELGDCGAYLSLKAPALGLRSDLVERLARASARRNVAIHFDSHAIEDADATLTLAERAARVGAEVGCTLPSRWPRSVEDARKVCALGLPVRVVKGQWADPDHPDHDARAGFRAVIEALAAGGARVRVATHDPELADGVLTTLHRAGIDYDLELLYGLPYRELLSVARAHDAPLRIYVPYGTSWLPYSIWQLRRNPRMLAWLLRDLASCPDRWLLPHRVRYPCLDRPRG